MKIKNESFIFLKYYIFIFIIQTLLSLIHNQVCNNCDIPDNNKSICAGAEGDCDCNLARPHFEDGLCYKCSKSEGFYIINSNGECKDKSEVGCPNKIIIGSNECVGHCPDNTCELGDYCYYDYDVANNPYNIELNTENPFNLCKCKFKYNKSSDTLDKEKYICLNEVGVCPNQYYNSDTLECVDNCGSNKKKRN